MLSALQRILIKLRLLKIPDNKVDGCSWFAFALWEKITGKPLKAREYCSEHDCLYWQGGAEQDRKIADIYLRDMVDKYWSHIWSILIYWNIRVFGWLFFNYHCNKEFYAQWD